MIYHKWVWDGMGQHDMASDILVWHGMGWHRMAWDGRGQHGMALDDKGGMK